MKSSRFTRLANLHWKIGPVVVIDVSTPKHPMAAAMVDSEFADLVLDGFGRWHARRGVSGPIYAIRRSDRGDQRMHLLLCSGGGRLFVDHANLDGLDNRNLNLRLATRSQNNANTLRRPSKRPYRGVEYLPRIGKWKATAGKEYLGCFVNEVAAALAFDWAARRLFGQCARPNFRTLREAIRAGAALRKQQLCNELADQERG